MSAIRPGSENLTGFRLAVLVEGGLGLVAIGLAWLFGISLRDQFAATRLEIAEGAMFGIVAVLPMLVTFAWLAQSSTKCLADLHRFVQQLVRELFSRATIFELAVIATLAGVSEELLFRGVLQTVIGQWTAPIIGLVVASLVFGAFHAMSLLYFALATIIGMYLGSLLLRFDDLTIPIVAHSLYDFVALVYYLHFRRKQR